MLYSYTKNLLFHYTSKERAIENILDSMTIRMGPLLSTNDPRETAPWFFGFEIENETDNLSSMGIMKLSQDIDHILRDSCRIACFSQDQPDALPERGDPDRYDRDLRQGFAHDRMWAQYADNHKGVCIFFDRDRLTQRMKEHFQKPKRRGHFLQGPVRYRDELSPRDDPFSGLSYDEIRQKGVRAFADIKRVDFSQQLYLTKNIDWASEEEYRYVWWGEDRDNQGDADFVSVEDCIRAICLGASFPAPYELNIRAVRERLGIDVHRVVYHHGKLQIVPALR